MLCIESCVFLSTLPGDILSLSLQQFECVDHNKVLTDQRLKVNVLIVNSD